MQEFITVWRRSTVGEFSWVSPSGPIGLPVVPLEWDNHPCVALPFAHADAVDTLQSEIATLSITDGSVLSDQTPGMVATGRVEISYDPVGDLFVEHLLEQEIVKHPPTRLRADSLISRRENWWWIGRILIRLTDATSQHPTPKRDRANDAVVVRGTAAAPHATVVTAADWDASEITLWPRDGLSLDGTGEAVFAFGHSYSPDFERWERWHRRGTLQRDTLWVSEAVGQPSGPLDPFGVVDRLRNHRDVQRACRAGIRVAERRGLG